MSFVAALIIGDSAVNAGLIGSAILIICAVSTIMSFVVPSFYEAVIALRIIFLVASGLWGAVGFAFSFVFLALNIAAVNTGKNSFIPGFTAENMGKLTDIFLKSSWRTLNKNDKRIQ